jgi:hypothetical protein
MLITSECNNGTRWSVTNTVDSNAVTGCDRAPTSQTLHSLPLQEAQPNVINTSYALQRQCQIQQLNINLPRMQ